VNVGCPHPLLLLVDGLIDQRVFRVTLAEFVSAPLADDFVTRLTQVSDPARQ
jgi:hypothetical protein